MNLSLLDHTLVWGMAGGMFPEILKWFRMRETLHVAIPDYAKGLSYWVATAAMVVAGGILAVAYEDQDVTIDRILAINIGASAPLVIKELLGQTPPIDKGNTS